MSLETFIGWRYLRAKRRQAFISLITLISLLGVALGVTALIVVLAVMNGFEEDLKDKILGVNSHVVVSRLDKPMDNYQSLLPKMNATKGVVSAEPFIYSQVMLSAQGGVTGAILRGVDPDLAVKVGPLSRSTTRGRIEELVTGRNGSPGILLGAELSSQLGLIPGDTVKVISPLGRVTPLGNRAPRLANFVVVGVFESGMYEYDATLAFVSIAEAQAFLNLGDTVTGLELRVDDIYKADRMRETLASQLGDAYRVQDWMQLNRNLFSALKLEKIAMFIILTLTILVAAFNIISTLIMVVMEKTRDIAILKSIGATGRMVMRIFVFQGVVIGVLGTVLGLMGGVSLCWLLAKYQFIQLPADVYYITTLPVNMEMTDILAITASAVIISFTATLYPAWQASRLRPVEALRYE
jgi:lipoprotein-releasing system permease protein